METNCKFRWWTHNICSCGGVFLVSVTFGFAFQLCCTESLLYFWHYGFSSACVIHASLLNYPRHYNDDEHLQCISQWGNHAWITSWHQF